AHREARERFGRGEPSDAPSGPGEDCEIDLAPLGRPQRRPGALGAPRGELEAEAHGLPRGYLEHRDVALGDVPVAHEVERARAGVAVERHDEAHARDGAPVPRGAREGGGSGPGVTGRARTVAGHPRALHMSAPDKEHRHMSTQFEAACTSRSTTPGSWVPSSTSAS